MLPVIGILLTLTASATLDCIPPVEPIVRDGVPYVQAYFADSWQDVSENNPEKALARLTKLTQRERGEKYIRPVVYTLYVLGHHLRSESRFVEARAFVSSALDLQTSLPELKLDDQVQRAEMLLSLGLTEQVVGDYDASALAYQQSIDITTAFPLKTPGPDKALMLGTAYVYQASLEYDKRRYSIAESLVIKAQKQTATPFVSAWGDIILASVFRQQGDFAAAEKLLMQAAESSRANCMPEFLALSQRNLGEIAIYYRPIAYQDKSVRLAAAIAYLETAESLYKGLGRNLEAGITRGHIGEVHAKLGKLAQAREDFESAHKEFKSAGFREEVGRMRHHLGSLLLRIADAENTSTGAATATDEAIQHFDGALEIYNELNDPEWQWRSFLGRGIAYQKTDEVHQAERDFQEATEILMAMRSSLALHTLGGRSEFQESYREPFDRLTVMLVKQDRLDEARQKIAQSDSISLRNNFLIDAASADEKTASAESSSSCSRLLFAYARLQQRSALTSLVHGSVSPGKAGNSAIDNEASEQPDASWEEISQTESIVVPDHAALVTYRMLPDSILIIATTSNDKFAWEIELSSKDLKKKVIRFLQTIERSRFDQTGGGWTASSRQRGRYNDQLITIGNELYQWLILPIRDFLMDKGVEALILSPDGILELIPFAALTEIQDDGQPKFLIEDYAIRRFSGKATSNLRRAIGAKSDVVAFVNPLLRNNKRATLQYSLELAQQWLYPKFNARIYSDVVATKDNFRLEWNNATVLHIGAHGVVTEDSPFLLFAPDEVQGRLSTCEILDLPLRSDLDLVVLEACESAVPVYRQSADAENNLRSLRYAFTARGAQSVIATLWRVGEGGSSRLMQGFYDRLNGGDEIQEALRNAQLSMLKNENTYAQPYYWAAFELFQSEKLNDPG